LTDIENAYGSDNYPNFKDHRHDQSIFSLLSKKYDFLAFRDPSQFGNDTKEFYTNSDYDQLINLDRKRNFPIHIKIKKYLKIQMSQIINFFR
jgi:hypothetical protein